MFEVIPQKAVCWNQLIDIEFSRTPDFSIIELPLENTTKWSDDVNTTLAPLVDTRRRHGAPAGYQPSSSWPLSRAVLRENNDPNSTSVGLNRRMSIRIR